jgi:hypothetical protein
LSLEMSSPDFSEKALFLFKDLSIPQRRLLWTDTNIVILLWIEQGMDNERRD